MPVPAVRDRVGQRQGLQGLRDRQEPQDLREGQGLQGLRDRQEPQDLREGQGLQGL